MLLNRVLFALAIAALFGSNVAAQKKASDSETVRVFVFAGQSNMVGSDSRVQDIKRFPPFAGLESPQPNVRFSYCLGREDKIVSDGWVPLKPINNIVGPELSFANKVVDQTDAPIAIIKVAAGGTHLGGDWNPDDPSGFKMYPLALQGIRNSLADLEKKGIPYRLEGFMWHQGENDMFNEDYQNNYGKNLSNFIASWRRDLGTPDLKFYIGELCTKTIWGMDLRPRMYAISQGQRAVAEKDPLVEYIPTSHVGVEIGGGVGLHYHYGTLGQLEHGVNYADAYLRDIDKAPEENRALKNWPYKKGAKVKLYVLAGHRNMEGERAFVQDLQNSNDPTGLLKADPSVAYKYSIGGGYKTSDHWEPLGPAGFYDTFGPELSFSKTLSQQGVDNYAIAKFTHSGSQIIDWTPEGSVAKSRNLYPDFLDFIRTSILELTEQGQEVELAGIIYHVGENDMSWGPFRAGAAERVKMIIEQSRKDLGMPNLAWYVSQQAPTDDKDVNDIDVTAALQKELSNDPHTKLIQVFDLPPQEKKLVLDTNGIVVLGQKMAESISQ